MVLNVNFVGSLLMGAIGVLCFLKLWHSYRKTEVQTVRYFAIFFLLFGVFELIIGFPQFLDFTTLSTDRLGAFYVFGHMIAFFMVAYYSKIPTHLLKPDWELPIFAANTLLAVGMTVVNFMVWIPNQFASNGQVFLYSMTPAPAWILMILLNWVIGGTLVFGYLAWKQSGANRFKFALLSLGITLMFLGGPLHTVNLSVTMQMIAEGVTVIGVIIVFFGVYWKSLIRKDAV